MSCKMNKVVVNSLIKLSEELDSFGIPEINVNVDVIEQLICNMYKLINIHRKSISKINEIAVRKSILINEKEAYQKGIEISNEKCKEQDKKILVLQASINKIEFEKNELKCDKNLLIKELNMLKSINKNKDLEYGHTINRLHLEVNNLRDKLGETVGKYKNNDSTIAEVINKHKAKELVYEDTIKKLQDNNNQLINEILNLKDEVLLALYNKSTD